MVTSAMDAERPHLIHWIKCSGAPNRYAVRLMTIGRLNDIKHHAGENCDQRSSVRRYAVSYEIRTARVVTSAMETKINKMFYAKVRDNIWIARPNSYLTHAAMVFEEAARLSYQLRQLWPQASALTPKVPAPFWLSHQTLRPIVSRTR